MPFLSPTQVASWFGVSEKTVMNQVKAGTLPKPFVYRNKPHFPLGVVLPAVLEDDDVKFMGGVTLKTDKGPIYFEVVKPAYSLDNFGKRCAVFQARGSTWHVRPWETTYAWMPNSLNVHDVILDCRDDGAPEMRHENLPELHSAHYHFFKTVRQRYGDFGRSQLTAD